MSAAHRAERAWPLEKGAPGAFYRRSRRTDMDRPGLIVWRGSPTEHPAEFAPGSAGVLLDAVRGSAGKGRAGGSPAREEYVVIRISLGVCST